ncbi:hypothetical protein FACS189472_11830 [Alphaproteobacteria bacterium]|nr:hypothetical protein FACS189472_11830 [Alphaproteobacteria bacterium]
MAEEKKGTLSLSRATDVNKSSDNVAGRVRQSFSHGKSKVVTVEVKKKRTPGISRPAGVGMDSRTSGNLTGRELETRIKVVQDAIKEEKERAELRIKQELERKLLQEEEERRRKEDEEARRIQEEADAAAARNAEIASVFEPQIPVDKGIVGKATIRNDIKEVSTHGKRVAPHKTGRYSSGNFVEEDDAVLKANAAKKTLVVKKDIKELKGKYTGPSSRVSIYNPFGDEEGGHVRSYSAMKAQLEAEVAKQKNQLIEKLSDLLIERLQKKFNDGNCQLKTDITQKDLEKLL